jgi:hypothetical protein
MSKTEITLEDDDGFEEVVEVPSKWEICNACRGEGVRALHGMAITSSEWAEWDPEEQEGYFRGDYDTPCVCEGGKVRVPDLDALPPVLRQRVEAHLNEEARYRAEERAYRRLESGDY